MRPLLILTCLLALVLGTIASESAVAAATGGGGASGVRTGPRTRTPIEGLQAARLALKLIGIRYRPGGASPRDGFDCSGLVRFVYGEIGIRLPHQSWSQFQLGRPVGRWALSPGDLVFFDGAGHVGIYLGAGRFVHAPHSGTAVQVSTLTGEWYRTRFDGGRRIA
jgi:cell wall-associated NlpC family hydrolase